MENRIILSRADFSANNIGRIIELTDLTKKVLSKQTQYKIGSDESIALDVFLMALKENGYIGGDHAKLSVLMIPALASGHDDLFYNICALDDEGYPTNWMPSAEDPDSPIYQVYTENGHNVGTYANATVGNNETLNAFNIGLGDYFVQSGQGVTRNIPSFCLFNYLCAEFNTGDRLIDGYNYSLVIKHSANYCSVGMYNGDSAVATTNMGSTTKGFYGLSYDGSKGSIVLNNNGNHAVSSTPVNGGINLTSIGYINTNFVLLSGNSNPVGATHSSIMGFGTGMTQGELDILKGYCDTLAAALHVTL